MLNSSGGFNPDLVEHGHSARLFVFLSLTGVVIGLDLSVLLFEYVYLSKKTTGIWGILELLVAQFFPSFLKQALAAFYAVLVSVCLSAVAAGTHGLRTNGRLVSAVSASSCFAPPPLSSETQFSNFTL